jgi:hypothetical protein
LQFFSSLGVSVIPLAEELMGNNAFPWQEKLIAPLIANPIGYLQCKDRVTKSEGKKTSTGYISDLFA